MREENYTRVAGQERSDCPFPEESLYNTEEKEEIFSKAIEISSKRYY